jgi:tetratricopeptide (TPR) repeat protein
MRALLAVSVIALAPRAALADMKPAAQAKFDAGVSQYSAGHYESAITLLEEAYELDPDPGVLFTWAQAERLAGKCKEAVPRYKKFIATRPSDEATALATNGIQLCEAEAKGIAPAPACIVAKPLPWYKDPVGGAVVAGVVGIGVGIGFFVASSGKSDRADSAQTSAEFNDFLDQATTQRRIGITLTVVGAGLIGGGLVYRHVRNKKSRGAVVGTTGTSLFVAGEF